MFLADLVQRIHHRFIFMNSTTPKVMFKAKPDLEAVFL
jgi:hypothetical protein